MEPVTDTRQQNRQYLNQDMEWDKRDALIVIFLRNGKNCAIHAAVEL